nr:zinc finger BED domain-containing protein RICESLEEPER 2-like [Tanacetum cinerariifolium]
MNESSVTNVHQSYVSNQAFISSHPAPRDRWSKDQHIKLVNIIGDPSEGMLTRSMAAKLKAASTIECLFADFLFEIEPPKKVSEALKHLGWVDAMQEELNYSSVKTPMVPPNNLGLDLAGKLVTEISYRVYNQVHNDEWRKAITLDFNTFTTSTGLDYNNGAYVAHPSPKSQGPEAFKALSKKRKQPMPKKTPNETKVSSPKPTEGSEQSHSINDKGLPSTASNKGTDKTTSRPEGLLRDKDSRGNKPPAHMEPINPTVTDPLGTEKLNSSLVQDTDEYTSDSSLDLKKFDNILPLTERQLVKCLRKVSRVLCNRLTEAQWAQHEEADVSYADLKDVIKGYYEENIDHREQTNKFIDVTMNSLDKNNIARGDLLNALNGVTEALKAIQNAIKEDLVLNKKVLEATKAYTKNFTHLTELLTLIRFSRIKVSLQPPQAVCHKQHLLSLKGQQILGENVTHADIEEPPSHTKGKHAAMEEEPTNAVPITTVKPTEIPTFEEEAKKIGLDPKKIISAKAEEDFMYMLDLREGNGKEFEDGKKEKPIVVSESTDWANASMYGTKEWNEDGNQVVTLCRNVLKELFNDYNVFEDTIKTMRKKNMADVKRRKAVSSIAKETKSELDRYLTEENEGDGTYFKSDNFTILGWWKKRSLAFIILSLVARDILVIPISTMASESTFSTGGRVLDSFRTSLTPQIVEALKCCQDWIRSSHVPISV